MFLVYSTLYTLHHGSECFRNRRFRPACSCLPPTVGSRAPLSRLCLPARACAHHSGRARAAPPPSRLLISSAHFCASRSAEGLSPFLKTFLQTVCSSAICLSSFQAMDNTFYARRHVRYGSVHIVKGARKTKPSAKGPVPLCRRLFSRTRDSLCKFFRSKRHNSGHGDTVSTSNSASVSTGMLPGSAFTPMAERDGRPASSPQSSSRS